MRPLLIATALLLAVPSLAASSRASYERAVRNELRDPSSAQFRALKVLPGGPEDGALCGEVNAKNAMGGYTGFEPFYAEMMGPRPRAVLYLASRVGLDRVRELCQAATHR